MHTVHYLCPFPKTSTQHKWDLSLPVNLLCSNSREVTKVLQAPCDAAENFYAFGVFFFVLGMAFHFLGGGGGGGPLFLVVVF